MLYFVKSKSQNEDVLSLSSGRHISSNTSVSTIRWTMQKKVVGRAYEGTLIVDTTCEYDMDSFHHRLTICYSDRPDCSIK